MTFSRKVTKHPLKGELMIASGVHSSREARRCRGLDNKTRRGTRSRMTTLRDATQWFSY